MNERAKEWLKGEMVDKDKWALAYDKGGKRYGIMTTNNTESVNNIFKGIRSRPIASIVEFSFKKLNEYFVDRWGKARSLLDKGQQFSGFFLLCKTLHTTLTRIYMLTPYLYVPISGAAAPTCAYSLASPVGQEVRAVPSPGWVAASGSSCVCWSASDGWTASDCFC